jgi:RHS repeat-associated protein
VRYLWGALPTTYNFTGQRLDGDTGLLYYGARYYDPALMRFIQPDTLVPDPANPQSLNRYAYVLNNPLKYTDPTGHDPLDAEWQEAFRAAHGRDPEWYDVLIRLFSIAFPDEWDWSKFYDPSGNLRGFDVLEKVFTQPAQGRNWDNMPDVLARLAGWYKPNETEAYVRDIGTLFAGLPDRFEQPSTSTAVSEPPLPRHVWAYLQAGGMPQYLTGVADRDANVHHWAWAFVLGYNRSILAPTINTVREIHQAGNNPIQAFTNIDSLADILLGNRGALMGLDVSTYGASPREIRRLFILNVWWQLP